LINKNEFVEGLVSGLFNVPYSFFLDKQIFKYYRKFQNFELQVLLKFQIGTGKIS